MSRLRGDVDIAAVAALIADTARARILLALSDGRALPASLLAAEAGVAASTASEHLRKLADAGLVSVHPQGRHRYFRLGGPAVAEAVESLCRLAPATEIRSLREGTRAHALRQARTCYDHLAGRLGVGVFASLLEAGAITGGDGLHRVESRGSDRLAASGSDVSYTLTERGQTMLGRIGVALPRPAEDGRIALRYCVDWSEQRHHLSGVVGRTLCQRLFQLGWLTRHDRGRAVRITEAGSRGIARAFGATALAA
jgi:DNA-binding transcriptional ArsR family regulator